MTTLPPGVDLAKTPIGPPPPGVTSNFIDPPSAAAAATGVVVTTIVLEIVFLSVRLYSNIRTFRKIAIDDWSAIVTTFLSFGLAFCILYLRPIGRHEWNISIAMSTTPDTHKVVITEEMLLGFSIFFGKCSILLLYLRIFSPDKTFRHKVYVAIAFSFATLLANIPIDAILCGPKPGTSWAVPNPNCSKSFNFALVQGIANLLVDLCILYLPIPAVMRLQMPKRRRAGVITIFMTGLIAIVADIIVMIYRVKMFKNIDPNYAGYITVLCSMVETGISVMVSSMPAMAAFSRLHILHADYLRSLRSRLFSRRNTPFTRHSKSRGRTSTSGSNALRLQLGNSYTSAPSDSDSFSHLQTLEFVSIRMSTEGPKTEIQGGAGQADLEEGLIQKPVNIQQSSEKFTTRRWKAKMVEQGLTCCSHG